MIDSVGKVRWVDDIVSGLKLLGGEASLHEIYKTVERIRFSNARTIPRTFEATIRRTIEDHSSDSEIFKGEDIFRKFSRGRWALR